MFSRSMQLFLPGIRRSCSLQSFPKTLVQRIVCVRTRTLQTKSTDIIIRTIKKDDEKQLTQFLNAEFFEHERISRHILSLTPHERVHILGHFYQNAFKNGLSVMAQCPTSGEMLGAIVATLEDRKHRENSWSEVDTDDDIENEKVLFEFMAKLSYGIDLFDMFSVDRVMHTVIWSVKQGFEGRGIITRLQKACEERAIEKGIGVAYVETTSARSRWIAQEMFGFRVLGEKTLTSTTEGDSSGDEDKEARCALMAKRLC